MQALSLDLRERIIKSWQQGQPKAAIARLFMGPDRINGNQMEVE